MRLWRLTRAPFVALDGSGPQLHGARYSRPGLPLVNFASEAGLAVLVALRYLPRDLAGVDGDYVLGWTKIDTGCECVPPGLTEPDVKRWTEDWLVSKRSLLASLPSKVLPEGNIVMMNPAHDAAENVRPLTTRPFDFAQCLHRPPTLDRYPLESG